MAPLLNPGDLVEVDGNATYPGDATFRRPGTSANPIVIRGILVGGKRPVISGGTNTVHFRTDSIGEGADHYVMEGFEITGGSSRCVFHQSHDLTLRDLVVRDCPSQGILGADWGSGSITIEHTEVYRCGGGTQDHQIYIGMDEENHPDSVFRLQFSYIHDANGGNNVKSRATRNEIYYNRIEGAYYHELEMIGAECCTEGLVREDSDVVGNLLVKKGPNADFSVTRIGGDGTAQTWGRYRFVNNTVIVAGSQPVFRIFDGLESVEMHNNVFYRAGGPVTIMRTVEAVWAAGERIAGSKNWTTSGSTNVPTQWTGTITGSSPGFLDAAGGNYAPATGSPLMNAGNGSPGGPPGSPFPGPLFPPAYQPPGTPGHFGIPNARLNTAPIDIGAYENPLPPAPPGLTNRFRLYSDVTKEHHYTTDQNEYVVLGSRGWAQEGIAHRVYPNETPVAGVTPVPLYRLYHPGIRQHLWTTDPNEYDVLGTRGWIQESFDGYILPEVVTGVTTPLYRLAYAYLPLHLWTVDRNEYDVLAGRGWVQEGVVGHVVP